MPRMSRGSVAWLGLSGFVFMGAGYYNVHAARLQDAGAAARAAQTAPAPEAATAAEQRALLDKVLRHVPQPAGQDGRAHARHRRHRAPRRVAGDVGEGRPHAADRFDAANRPAAAGAGRRRARLATFLEDGLDRAAAAAPNAGRIPPHRLNRTEYANAVRDLLGVDIPPTLLPADNSILGFDNIAGALTVSPMLLERYMAVARQVSRLAVGDTTMMVAPVTYNIDSSLRQTDRASEDLPFGARGITVQHNFPLDGEYVVQVRLKRTQNEYIRGLGRKPAADGAPGGRRARQGVLRGRPDEGHSARSRATRSPIWARPTGKRTRSTATTPSRCGSTAKAGTRVLALSLPGRRWDARRGLRPAAPRRARRKPRRQHRHQDGRDQRAVQRQEAGGLGQPQEDLHAATRPATPSRSAARRRFSPTLAKRAYRRPVSDKDVQTLMQFCRSGLARGFDACIQTALERILASPYFLYPRRGPGGRRGAAAAGKPIARAAFSMAAPRGSDALAATPSAEPAPISDLDLASRLSFFLWSSIPDDQLLDLAAQHKLRDPAVLDKQVRRMLADPRSRALVDNFADQWLEPSQAGSGVARRAAISRISTASFACRCAKRPSASSTACCATTGRFPSCCPRTTRSSTSGWPGTTCIPNIVGNRFRRVTMPPDRVGLLGQGSILLVTSQANRTSPVLRGKFILDNILGAPVPPPPPNVPTASRRRTTAGTPVTVREALEKHRANPVCANCHARMDPWGFALENIRRHRRPAVGRGRLRDRHDVGAARRHEARRARPASARCWRRRAISSSTRCRRSSWSTRWAARSSITTGRRFEKSRKRRLPRTTGGRR